MSTFYNLSFISSMCKILWKKWLKYFCWSDEASDSCWDDSESDTPDHSTGLGWAGRWLDTIHNSSFVVTASECSRNCVSPVPVLSTIKLPTFCLLYLSVSSPGSWLVFYPPPQSVTCVLVPSLLSDLHLRHWRGTWGLGPAITFPTFLHLSI